MVWSQNQDISRAKCKGQGSDAAWREGGLWGWPLCDAMWVANSLPGVTGARQGCDPTKQTPA